MFILDYTMNNYVPLCFLWHLCRRSSIGVWILTRLVIGQKLDCECMTVKYLLVRMIQL